ncbi:hypothetical protein ACIA4R_09150 [Lactobacillus delbrueckii subsp. bulgaricus]
MKLKRVWLVKLIFVLAFAIILAPKAKTTTASDADKPFYKNAMVNTYVYDEKGKRTKDKKIRNVEECALDTGWFTLWSRYSTLRLSHHRYLYFQHRHAWLEHT